ncbi:MAG: methyltransferase domain-containing protein [Actinomycetota bacterium]
MDILVCPACRGELADTCDAGSYACISCGRSYPVFEGHASFVAADKMGEFARWQMDIYDGNRPDLAPPDYSDLERVRSHNEGSVEVTRASGALSPNWKGVKSREVADRLAPLPGERVLDVGCGLGTLLDTMVAAYGTTGVGIDLGHAGLKAAIACNTSGHGFHEADALNLPFRDGAFDLTVSYDVIEHVDDPARFVSETVRVLRPGGRLLIYTPSARDRWTWHWWERLLLRGRYNLGMDNLAGHDPARFLEPAGLAALLEDAGLRAVGTESFHSLFTLILDEVYPGFFYRVLKRARFVGPVFRMLELADSPLSSAGYGNGFFAWGWKA